MPWGGPPSWIETPVGAPHLGRMDRWNARPWSAWTNRHDNVGLARVATFPACAIPAFARNPPAMTITITPAASERMHQFLAQTPGAAGVRFGVKRTGCSGFGYVVDLAQSVGEGDRLVSVDG